MILGSVRSQHQNLGDLVIRRNMVHWMTGLDDVRLIVGDMPEQFVTALKVPDGIRLCRTTRSAILPRPAGSLMSVVFAPGEQSLEDKPRVIAAALANFSLAFCAKASGGSVVKLGRGFKGSGAMACRIERAVARFSDGVYVRDAEASSVIADSTLVPDIALWGGVASVERLADPFERANSRQGVAVSMRFDRGEVPASVRRLVTTLASLDGGPIVVPVQVQFDASRGRSLAGMLGGVLVPWAGDHESQLHQVEETYDNVRFVVSDRLHVLLFGLLRGAVPVGVETGQGEKLARQLRPIGLDSLVVASAGATEALAERIVASLPTNQALCARALGEAQAKLDIVRGEVRSVLTPDSVSTSVQSARGRS